MERKVTVSRKAESEGKRERSEGKEGRSATQLLGAEGDEDEHLEEKVDAADGCVGKEGK